MTKTFTIGQTVRVLEDAYAARAIGLTGTVVETDHAFGDATLALVDFGPSFPGHTGSGRMGRKTGWWIDTNDLTDAGTTAKEPTAPMQKAVLDLLRTKGAVTSIEAQGVLRCRQLPARILELKKLGHKIVTELKFDPTGQRYARYHLQAAA